jgi:cysteinyl-tRNA synthetase
VSIPTTREELVAGYRTELGEPISLELEKHLHLLGANPYNHTARNLDTMLVNKQWEAQKRIHLFLRKRENPGVPVQHEDGQWGFIPVGDSSVRTPIEHLVSVRLGARVRGNWDRADRLRVIAERCGYALGDHPDGTDWVWIDPTETAWIREAEVENDSVFDSFSS